MRMGLKYESPLDKQRWFQLEQPSPYAVHSYLEDRDKLETGSFLNESTRTHIRSIGVPVLPPLGRDFPDFSGGPSPAQNKAFLRHLENHRKFDTMKSLKSCKDCPLCQMMMGTGWQEEWVQSFPRLMPPFQSGRKDERPTAGCVSNDRG